eukprot:TRINITY_DN1162_c0_g1_i1.p1 TRINITY_DN1162_c0_g1~~TRINITY_DN1162_c0_g1_i1.p1  ORF type:complete len:122 (-),score=30.13 TRINITY_DN1162_c0_g1_i1:61-426(-)
MSWSLTAFGVTRALVGAACWLFPNVAAGFFGLRVKNDWQTNGIARLFGARDFVFGVATVVIKEQAALKALLQLLVIVDSLDALGGLFALPHVLQEKRALYLTYLGALAFVLIGYRELTLLK